MIQTTYCKRFSNSCYHCKFGIYEYQKTRRIIGIDLYVDDLRVNVDDMQTQSILFIRRGVGIANASPNYVHWYD